MRSWCMQCLFLPGVSSSASSIRQSNCGPCRRHIRLSAKSWEVFWRHLLCCSPGPTHEAWLKCQKSTGLSEVIWCNAITKVKKIKILHGYAITCPLFQLLLLPPLTDVRIGIWMLGNEKVIHHEVTCAELWMLVTAHEWEQEYVQLV